MKSKCVAERIRKQLFKKYGHKLPKEYDHVILRELEKPAQKKNDMVPEIKRSTA